MLASDDSSAGPARLAAVLDKVCGTPPAPLPPLDPVPVMRLARGRVHEVTGASRQVLAAALAGRGQGEGPVLWLRPEWGVEALCPQGLAAFADPGALVTVACPRAPDVLWAAEEALRSGSVALVLAELAAAPDLRQIRRLHRAAAEGVVRARNGRAEDARRAPLGVLMMQDRAESRIAGVESRWALHPLPRPADGGAGGGPAWLLERLLARGAPPGNWLLRPGARGLEIG